MFARFVSWLSARTPSAVASASDIRLYSSDSHAKSSDASLLRPQLSFPPLASRAGATVRVPRPRRLSCRLSIPPVPLHGLFRLPYSRRTHEMREVWRRARAAGEWESIRREAVLAAVSFALAESLRGTLWELVTKWSAHVSSPCAHLGRCHLNSLLMVRTAGVRRRPCGGRDLEQLDGLHLRERHQPVPEPSLWPAVRLLRAQEPAHCASSSRISLPILPTWRRIRLSALSSPRQSLAVR